MFTSIFAIFQYCVHCEKNKFNLRFLINYCDVKDSRAYYFLVEGGGANISFSISLFQPTHWGSAQIDLDLKTVGELHDRLNTHTHTHTHTHTMGCVHLCDCVCADGLSDPACPLSIISSFFFFPPIPIMALCNASIGFMQHHSQTQCSPLPCPSPHSSSHAFILLKSLIHVYSTEELLYVSTAARDKDRPQLITYHLEQMAADDM